MLFPAAAIRTWIVKKGFYATLVAQIFWDNYNHQRFPLTFITGTGMCCHPQGLWFYQQIQKTPVVKMLNLIPLSISGEMFY